MLGCWVSCLFCDLFVITCDGDVCDGVSRDRGRLLGGRRRDRRGNGRCKWRAWVSQWRDGTEAVDDGRHREAQVQVVEDITGLGVRCHGIGRV